MLGTAGYMSPEQASGQATDQRADVWSFGVVVYEMLTGQPLFAGESVPHILADVLRADPDWERLPANLHPRIRLMLERCLEKKPRNRYHAIADARVDIEAALKDPDGAVVRDLAGGAAVYRPPASRRLLPWAAGLALALAAGAAAWTVRAPAPKPVIRAVYPLPDEAGIMIPDSREIAISPDGRRIAYNLNDGLHVRRLDEFGDLLLPRLPVLHLNPVFSADGESIAFLAAGESLGSAASLTLARISASGGAPLPVAPIRANVSWGGMSWEPDGMILYAEDEGIWRVGENGGEPELLIETEPDEEAAEPSLLPGGEWVLFSVAQGQTPDWDQARIVAESLISSERRVLRTGGSSARYVPTGHLIYAFGDVLYAVPFDAGDPALTGGPVQVVQGVRRSTASGTAQYALSDDGTLIYLPGGVGAQDRLTLAVADRDARITRYPMPTGNYAFPRVSPDGSSAAFTATYADGALLAYTVRRKDGTSIWILDVQTNEAESVMKDAGIAYSQPVFSPNGRWIAYQSTETGDNEIFVQPYPPTGAKYQLPHTLDNHHPVWSADGSELVYTPGPTQFESMPITTEPRFGFGAAVAHPNSPFNGAPDVRRRYDVMPDGSGFVGFVQENADAADSGLAIYVVFNWFEELRQRVPVD